MQSEVETSKKVQWKFHENISTFYLQYTFLLANKHMTEFEVSAFNKNIDFDEK